MAKKKPAPKGKAKKPRADPREDPRRDELIRKVADFCAAEFGGNYRAMFNDCDRNGDSFVTVGELKTLLTAAGVGTFLTRSAWARAVVEDLDSDGDGKIAPAEFEAVLTRGGGPRGATTTHRSADVFELITQVRELIDDVKAGDWTGAGRTAADLLKSACDLIDAWTTGAVMAADPAADTDFAAAVAELESCCARPVVGAADPVGFNPAVIVAIVQGVIELLKWIRDRRRPPAPTP